MVGHVKLVHSVRKSDLETVLREGLKAAHGYSYVGLKMRRGWSSAG